MQDSNVCNYFSVENINPLMSNICIYGLENSLRVSGFPMQTEDVIENLDRKMKRGIRLGKESSNSGHDNFLCGIIVQFDIIGTIKFWTEMERYHFADIVSSQSTMHRIIQFDKDSFNEYTNPKIIEEWDRLRELYKAEPTKENYLTVLMSTPVGLKLKAGMTTNYRQLKVIYEQRKNHKLPEWKLFCNQILELPYFKELTGVD